MVAREPFRDSSALSAVLGKVGGFASTGRLSMEWAERYGLSDVTYTVVSYGTPIAWVLSDGAVVIPTESYSLTTTQHQAAARRALTAHGETVITSL